MIGRRSFLAGLAAPALARRAWAQSVTDGAGRTIAIPSRVERILPAGPPASILVYVLAPDLLAGWTRRPTPEEAAFLLPDIAARPEVGRITGRGNTANLELVLSARPDLIVDSGSVRRTFVELADRVQDQTRLPYALFDGRFGAVAGTFRALGRLVDRTQRAETLARWTEETLATLASRIATVPQDRRPRVYYARGPRGLETGLAGSINVETIEALGAINVARGGPGSGLATVSPEQILAWDPEVIVTIDAAFAAAVRSDPAWAGVRAVREGRIHLAPRLPFGWIDFPPSVNRLAGLWWLGKIFYPSLVTEDLRVQARDFHALFYHVTPSDGQIERVLAGGS